jgi:glycine/D-amino acid oxidase-like deaminating enzyme/nitrite reductase/ring-hydroxylating ferredoxin subunit
MARRDTGSYWLESASLPTFPRLDRDLAVDVIVIGAGLAGITAAYLLKRAGRRVALIDRGRAASIDTGHTSAHLTCVTDTRLSSLVRSLGDDHAQAVWDAGLAAIAQIDEIVRSERLACHFDWVPGYLHAAVDAADADIESLRDEAAIAAKLGFDATFLDRTPFMDCPGVEIGGQARFHPREYLSGLIRSIDGGGSFVFEHTNADEVSDEPLSVVSRGHRLRGDYIVVMTHNPIVGAAGLVGATILQTTLFLYSSYVVAGRVEPGTVPDALFWDTADPYHYLRLDPRRGFDCVILGGEDHKTGQETDTDACFDRLEKTLKRLVPSVDLTHGWSGQVIETKDGLPYIGEVAPRQFAATGFSGNGMTFGTLAGMMAADAATGQQNPWSALFDVNRTRIATGLWNYLKENKDYPYYLIRDQFAGAEGKTLRAVKRGTGKILDLKGQRVAAYRDDDGKAVLRSPICTHMGCVVQWNGAERTWDCPCHGSRFSPTGQVISGPAETPLEPVPDLQK